MADIYEDGVNANNWQQIMNDADLPAILHITDLTAAQLAAALANVFFVPSPQTLSILNDVYGVQAPLNKNVPLSRINKQASINNQARPEEAINIKRAERGVRGAVDAKSAMPPLILWEDPALANSPDGDLAAADGLHRHLVCRARQGPRLGVHAQSATSRCST